MRITVFGSSKPKPGEIDYINAQQLGRMIAEGGHTVITGGYMGTMEAASQGAATAGGHVIGITCEEIERFRNHGPNPWVIEERRTATLIERLEQLIHSCDAAIALPGGPGTLVEVALLWNLLVIRAITPRSLVLVGGGWRKVFNQYRDSHGYYVNEGDWDWVHFADDHAAAYQKAVALNTPEG